jgi:hypothetical protein
MLQSVIAVYSKKNPARKSSGAVTDTVLWHHYHGFNICLGGQMAGRTLHGLVAWAVMEGSEERVEVRLDLKTKEFILPETFRQRKLMLAEANREKHKLVPFGVQRRQRRRLEEGLPAMSLGWAQP